MKLPAVTKKFWVVTLAIAIVAILLAFYLLIYVKDRESHIIAKNYRALARLGKNVVELRHNYEISIARRDTGMMHFVKNNGLKYLDYFELLDAGGLKEQGIEWSVGHKKENNFLTIELSPEDPLTKRHFHTSAGEFLNRSNISSRPFPHFFLIRVIHYPGLKTKAHADSVTFGIGYQTFSNQIELKNIDSLCLSHYGVQSIPLRDIVLAGKLYKFFGHRLQFRENEDWILCGMTPVSDFKRAARSVDSYHLVFAILIVLLVLLAMPVLKLLIMNSIERLRLINVWFTGFSIAVATSVFLLIILSVNQYWGYKGIVKKRLTELSDSVETRFLKELSEIHHQLTTINKKHEAGGDIRSYPFVFTSGRKYLRTEVSGEPSCLTDTVFLEETFTYPYFYDMMWSDKKGDQHLALSAHDLNPYIDLFNLSKRSYFSNARDGNLWTLPPRTSGVAKQFAMQSIRSWVDGRPSIGFSIRLPEMNGDAQVLSMVTRLNSLMHPLLPAGYGYCIIDEKGEAWFHSETDKNTQENFVDEADQDPKIVAAIQGRMAIHFESYYHDERHQMYVQPLDNIPLYLVTYYDLNYYKAPLILTIGFALPVTLLLFSLLGIQLFLQYISVYKPTKLKIKRFYLYWIRPRLMKTEDAEGKKVIGPLEKYVRAIVTLSGLALLSLGMAFCCPSMMTSFCLLVLPLYIFPFLYFLFEQETIKADQKWKTKNVLFHPFAWLSLMLIVLVNVALYSYIDDDLIFIVQLGFVAIILVGFHWKVAKIFIDADSGEDRQKLYHKLYIAMIFLWLFNVSIIPVFSFYKTAIQTEFLVWTKYIQWEAANKAIARLTNLSSEFKNISKAEREKGETSGDYLFAKERLVKALNLGGYNKQKSTELHYLEFITRPPMAGVVSVTRAMLEGSAADEKWSWYDHKGDSGLAIAYLDGEGRPLHSIVQKPSLDLWESETRVLFLVLTAALALLIYRATLFAIHSIFGLGITLDTKLIAESIREIRKDELICHDASLRKIFIVGLPYSGKGDLLELIKDDPKKDGIKLSQSEILELNIVTEWSRPFKLFDEKIVILKNFDYGINNHAINQRKLEWIQTAMDKHVSVIVSSTAQPSSIIEFYEQSIQRLSLKDGVEKRQEYKQAIRLWKNALAGFVTYYQPLGTTTTPIKSTNLFVKGELEHGTYLPKLESLLKNESTNTYAEQENFVLKVEELAGTYYHSIWNSFSHEEKFLLYDLAKDRFVNLRNIKAIRMLLQKGIIVAGDSLQLMNKSFNNFILNVVNEDDEMRMQQELNRKGSWNVVYTVLIVLVFGVLVFITLAQQNLLNDINLMLGVLGSLAAILGRFGGFLSNSKRTDQT